MTAFHVGFVFCSHFVKIDQMHLNCYNPDIYLTFMTRYANCSQMSGDQTKFVAKKRNSENIF